MRLTRLRMTKRTMMGRGGMRPRWLDMRGDEWTSARPANY
jgi:hypothetical protein